MKPFYERVLSRLKSVKNFFYSLLELGLGNICCNVIRYYVHYLFYIRRYTLLGKIINRRVSLKCRIKVWTVLGIKDRRLRFESFWNLCISTVNKIALLDMQILVQFVVARRDGLKISLHTSSRGNKLLPPSTTFNV